MYLKKNRLSKSLTTNCEDLDILHYFYNKSSVSFTEQYKDILTEASHIAGRIDHHKIKNIRK